jgi:hypothetical protein
MTTVAGADSSVSVYTHRRESADSRKPGRSRLALAVAGIAVIGTAGVIAASQPHSSSMSPVVGPVPGEFRLAPGNQTPPGIVIPLNSQGAVPGEFRLGPGNATPPGVVVPLS